MANPPTKKPISVVTARTKNKTLRRVQRHVLLAAAYERGLASDIEKVLRRISRSAAKHVADGSPEQATKVVGAYQAGLTRIFEGRLETVAMASAKLVFEELSAEKGGQAGFETKFLSLFEIAQAAVRSWLTSYAAAKVVQILENTRTQIRKAIVRGNDQNEPPRVLARRIKDETGGLIAKRRAETIARTETHTAANVGSDEAATATGLALEKEWMATEDARTRPTHHEANGQRVDKDMDFIVGGERLRFPGDPKGSAGNVINCRCIVLWHPKVPK
jgi:SPP1 gp7 family putative phage head morphogenesis protein